MDSAKTTPTVPTKEGLRPAPLFDIISVLAPRAKPSILDAFSLADAVLPAHDIVPPLRLPHFLAQVLHESGGLSQDEESLAYSAQALRKTWPKRFPDDGTASRYAPLSVPPGQEREFRKIALANLVYGGRMGNSLPGDGWRYRGRGLIQVTGREMYARIGARLGIDLVEQPDQACNPLHSLSVAACLWTLKGCNAPADAGDLAGVTRLINGGLIGLPERKATLIAVKAALTQMEG